jgi:hypothetical protein
LADVAEELKRVNLPAKVTCSGFEFSPAMLVLDMHDMGMEGRQQERSTAIPHCFICKCSLDNAHTKTHWWHLLAQIAQH